MHMTGSGLGTSLPGSRHSPFMYMQLKQASRHLQCSTTLCIHVHMHNVKHMQMYTYTYMYMYLYGVLHVQCWSYDRHDERAVVL